MKNMTKKRIAQVAILLAMMLTAVGCGKEVTEAPTEVIATSTPSPTVTPTSIPEVVATSTPTPTPTPEVTAEAEEMPEIAAEAEVEATVNEAEELSQIFDTASLVKNLEPWSPYLRNDMTYIYSVPANQQPYFIGRDNYEDNINFIKTNKGENDGVLYLGLPMYLPDCTPKGTTYVTVDNKEIAVIEGNDLVGLEQGTFTLSCYDQDKNLIEEKKFVCSTYNDSKTNLESLMTIKTSGTMKSHINMNSAEYWKDTVHTMMDMSYMLQVREFRYDFNKEPKFGGIQNCGDENRWSWTVAPETIFDISGGVCIQVAQLACYMLAEDYEDWGVVLVEGNQGHIFNWFFEDGYYYIFDFTDVISENAWGRSDMDYMNYWDYSDRVKKFQSIDEIKDYIVTEKVNTQENYLVYMYSCKGHDYIAANLNTGMSDSRGVVNGDYDSIIIGYQDVVMQDLVVLYQNENSSDIEFRSYAAHEISDVIPYGIYNDNNILKYRFKY